MMEESRRKLSLDRPATYQIKVPGHLDERALFLIAMVTSLLGGIWLESMMEASDYLVEVSAHRTQVELGVLLELINCIAVVGIAAALFPLMKKHNEALAAGYLGTRVIEAVILGVAVISPLLLVTLSQEYLAAGAADAAYFQTAGTLVKAAREHLANLLTPIFFSLAALFLYYFLYRQASISRSMLLRTRLRPGTYPPSSVSSRS
jgi:hypothetical protein